MSVLAKIGRRLKTDLADMSRAAIDPKFSQQLTAHRFNQEDIKANEASWLKRHSVVRQEQMEDQARQEKYKTQLGIVGELFKKAEISGDFSPIVDFSENPKLMPEIADYAKLLGSNVTGKSWEVMKQESEWNKEFANLTLNQQKFALERNKFAAAQQEYLMDYYQKNKEAYIDNIHQFQEDAKEAKSVYSIQQFFRNDPNMDEEQRQRYMGIVNEPGMDLSTAQKALDGYLREVDSGIKAENRANKPLRPTEEFRIFKDARDDYQQLTKDIRPAMQAISEIENLIDQNPSGVTDKAITAKITQVFGSKVRALAELNQWRNLGDITERIGGSLNTFFKGNRTEKQFKEIKNVISDYKKELNKADKKFKADTWDRAANFLDDPSKLFPNDKRFTVKEFQGKSYLVDTWREEIVREIGAP